MQWPLKFQDSFESAVTRSDFPCAATHIVHQIIIWRKDADESVFEELHVMRRAGAGKT
jgi:hypothetical protein